MNWLPLREDYVDGSALPNGEVNGSGEPLRRVVAITNPLGLHLRAAKKVVEAARRFQSAISVCWKDRRVNAKSMFDLLLIGAPLGSELTVEAYGDDAAAALEVVAEVLGAPSADDTPGPSDVPAIGL